MTTTPRRANRWTLTRRLADLIPHVLPGRHHIIWTTP